jgi:ribosomal protein S18 acetylase RimI-like enzyme
MFNLRIAEKPDAPMLAAHNCAMALETENKRLDGAIATLGVEGLFERPEFGFYLVAKSDSLAAASLLVTYEWSDWRNGLFWWIQSVYVKPEFRRLGVYREMYDYLKEMALSQSTPVCGFRLYAETENHVAQSTYKHLGMHACEYIMFEEAVL